MGGDRDVWSCEKREGVGGDRDVWTCEKREGVGGDRDVCDVCRSWIVGAGSDVCPFSYHCRGHDWQKPSIDLSRRRHQHKSHQRWVWMEEEGSVRVWLEEEDSVMVWMEEGSVRVCLEEVYGDLFIVQFSEKW